MWMTSLWLEVALNISQSWFLNWMPLLPWRIWVIYTFSWKLKLSILVMWGFCCLSLSILMNCLTKPRCRVANLMLPHYHPPLSSLPQGVHHLKIPVSTDMLLAVFSMSLSPGQSLHVVLTKFVNSCKIYYKSIGRWLKGFWGILLALLPMACTLRNP